VPSAKSVPGGSALCQRVIALALGPGCRLPANGWRCLPRDTSCGALGGCWLGLGARRRLLSWPGTGAALLGHELENNG